MLSVKVNGKIGLYLIEEQHTLGSVYIYMGIFCFEPFILIIKICFPFRLSLQLSCQWLLRFLQIYSKRSAITPVFLTRAGERSP
jgi:hypothetical protein